MKITSICGNSQWLDGGSMFGNVPRPMWEKWMPPDSKGRIKLATRSLLIEDGDLKILCEAGIGDFFEPKLAERYGVEPIGEHVLLNELEKMGIKDRDINYVILSHLHFDHAGGLLSSYNPHEPSKLLFPNAKFIASEGAIARALSPHPRDKASFIPGLVKLLKESPGGLKTQLNLENIDFFWSSGHTPDQMLTVLTGKKQKLIFCGDLVPGKAWVHTPITMGYDRNAEQVIDEKMELYKIAAEENWLLFFTHDPEIAGGTLWHNKESKKYEVKDEIRHMLRMEF